MSTTSTLPCRVTPTIRNYPVNLECLKDVRRSFPASSGCRGFPLLLGYAKKMKRYFEGVGIMAIRVYNSSDFEGEKVVFSTESFYLGEAKDYAIQHKCNIMIRSWNGWYFKRETVDLSTNTKPEKVIEFPGRTVYILYP